MDMTLTALFDFQHFAQNEALAELIHETERRYGIRELSDDDLDAVWAAGSFDELETRKKIQDKSK